MEITGIWTDRADKFRTASDEIKTDVNDSRMFFNVIGSAEVDAVRFHVYIDGKEAFMGGTNLDADGRQTVVFDVPAGLRTAGKHDLRIVLLDADESKPNVELTIYDIKKYTLIYT